MKILFSISNTKEDIGYYQRKGYSHLAILNTVSKQIYYIKLPEYFNDTGITGLASDKKYFYAVTHTKGCPILIRLLRDTLEVDKKKVLKQVKDPHQMIILNNRVLVCSSGTNSIESFNKKTFNLLGTYWQHPKTKRKVDEVHINSIFIHRGNVWVSCFGRKNGLRWSTAEAGYLLNTKTNEKYFSIHQPHSAISYKGRLYYCESTSGFVKVENKLITSETRVYVRGLDVNIRHIVYGISSGRLVSKSLQKVNSPTDRGRFLGKTGIVLFNNKTKKRMFYNLLGLGKEIFDLMIINKDDAKLSLAVNGIDNLQKINNISDGVYISSLVNENEKLRVTVDNLHIKLTEAEEFINNITASKFYRLWKGYCWFKGRFHLN